MSEGNDSALAQDVRLDDILNRVKGLEAAGKAKGQWIEWAKIIVPSLVSVVAIIAASVQATTTSALAIRQSFSAKRIELCQQASGYAAQLASTSNPDTWKQVREQFWTLYWGPLAIVEDQSVASRMVAFGQKLSALDSSSQILPAASLDAEAIDIAHACRDLIIESSGSKGFWSMFDSK